MALMVPSYYDEFKCIADRCSHNCCIGWEIDIDEETLALYEGISGELGGRLRENILQSPAPHFVLGQDERCPFLNNNNLCDIISELGENAICNICRDHPRFINELPDRDEMGLGLCCEEAARIIIARKEKADLPDYAGSDKIMLLREEIFSRLQNREKGIEERIFDAFALFGREAPDLDIKDWCRRLLSLERLCDDWGEMLENTIRALPCDLADFDRHMSDRLYEYEQFLVYIIFRHFAVAPNMEEAFSRLCFAALGFYILRAMGAAIFALNGEFTVADQLDLVRMFSSEIEYSDENLYAIIDSF